MVPQGVHASMSGIPWWTTDVGGYGCNFNMPNDSPYMRELIVRWYVTMARTLTLARCGSSPPHGTLWLGPTPLARCGSSPETDLTASAASHRFFEPRL